MPWKLLGMSIFPGTDAAILSKQGESAGEQSLQIRVGRVKGWEVSDSKLYHRVANPPKFETCLS